MLPSSVISAQRYQHGQVKVLLDLFGLEVYGLRSVGIWATGNVSDGVRHCQKLCFSNIYCQFWQYGSDGCWVEDEQHRATYPLTTASSSSVSDFAKTMVKGQYIQHYCAEPPDASSANPYRGQVVPVVGTGSQQVRMVLTGVAFIVILFLCISYIQWEHANNPANPALGYSQQQSSDRDLRLQSMQLVSEQPVFKGPQAVKPAQPAEDKAPPPPPTAKLTAEAVSKASKSLPPTHLPPRMLPVHSYASSARTHASESFTSHRSTTPLIQGSRPPLAL